VPITPVAALLSALTAFASPATPSAAATQGPAPPSAVPCHACWHPHPATQPWQWQLQGRIDLSIKAPVYDIDMDDPASAVDRIHARGAKAICYVDVGSWEPYRSDAGQFPKRVLGRHFQGFPNERWLDVRKLRVLRPIMAKRFDTCARKGFDAVEPDNEDGYQNRTGFPITYGEQLRYDRWISNAIRRRGMTPGLKNDLGQVRAMLPYVGFEINEQCFQYNECGRLRPFIAHGKPVFGAEYQLPPSRFCPKSKRLGFSTIRKRYSLRAWRRTCA
jgi:hypothetical protein